MSLTFAGKVTTSGTATYWCETDNGPVPAVGPALVRDQEEIPADAGVLIVRAMSCDVDKPTDGFNWYGQCQRPAGKTWFRLKQLQGTQEDEKQNAETDDEGRRNFRGLAPGTYRLASESKGWCHAECDSADDKGDVLIEAGKRTSLWVFNCAKVK